MWAEDFYIWHGRLEKHQMTNLDDSSDSKPERMGSSTNAIKGNQITPREREALFYTALGLNGRQIADEMNIEYQTVKNHRSNAYIKLDVYSAAEAIALLMVTDQNFYDEVKQSLLEKE